MGESDTGKTTLVRDLANSLAARGSVGIVDADLGQSEIGPPTTIGLGRVVAPLARLGDAEIIGLRFVGTTSAARDPRETVAATGRLVDRARAARLDRILVDTCGLVAGDFGRRLKQAMIRAIDPDLVIALERHAECDAIVHSYGGASRPLTVRSAATAPARGRTAEVRRRHRERALAAHLAGARSVTLDVARVPVRRPALFAGDRLAAAELTAAERIIGKPLVWGGRRSDEVTVVSREPLGAPDVRALARALRARRLSHHAVDDLEGVLAGMETHEQEMLGLGIIEAIDFARGVIQVKTPVTPERIQAVAIGRERYAETSTPAAGPPD